ncbi:alpha/beta fold hydrolase [Tsukamurella serpentis]
MTAVVIAPALGVPAGAYRRLVAALEQQGVAAVAVEYDWQTGDDYAHLYRRQLPDAVARARRQTPGPVWVLGHSLGAQAAVLGGVHGTLEADGLMIVSGGVPAASAYPWRDRWKPLAGTAFALVVAHLRGGVPAGTAGVGVAVPTRLIDEWTRWCWLGTVPGGVPGGASRASFDRVMAVVVEGDDLAPRGATDALLALLGAPEPQVIETAVGHGHSAWLREPDGIAGLVADTIDS